MSALIRELGVVCVQCGRFVYLVLYCTYIAPSLKIWKDWSANTVVAADFVSMSIARAPAIEPVYE